MMIFQYHPKALAAADDEYKPFAAGRPEYGSNDFVISPKHGHGPGQGAGGEGERVTKEMVSLDFFCFRVVHSLQGVPGQLKCGLSRLWQVSKV